MIARNLFWRAFVQDRIFLFLFTFAVLSFVALLLKRVPSLEHTTVPFNLGLLFFSVNMLFAITSLRREPLLAYLFLTAALINNGALYSYYTYLASIHVG